MLKPMPKEYELKAKAVAPANIAFIKYWGKVDEKLRLPANSSISMNLSNALTETEVFFSKDFTCDEFYLNNEKMLLEESERVIKHIDLMRDRTSYKKYKVKVHTTNNFPKGAGIASSASGFAALTLAVSDALKMNLSEKELSIYARLGSGSACRSVPDGFVEWKKGSDSNSSYAHSLYDPEYWNLRDIIILAGEKSKKVSSTQGHAIAESSPFYLKRIEGMERKIKDLKIAFKHKDFNKMGTIIENEAINMHAVMMTSNPALIYWNQHTLKIIDFIYGLRQKGIDACFTIDAGPNIHLICESLNQKKIISNLKKELSSYSYIVNKPCRGAYLIK